MASAVPNVDYVLLAEFDIDKGSSIRAQYPKPSGVNEQFLAEMMLPDGVHKWEHDHTIFFINRGLDCEKNSPRKSTSPQVEEQPKPLKQPFLAFLYEFEESAGKGWVLQGKKSLSLWPKRIEIRERGASLSEEALYVIAKHDDLAYTQLEPLFSCVLTESGVALGFRFSKEQEETAFSEHVDALIKDETSEPEEPEEKEEPEVEEEPGEKPLLYCFSRVVNQRDDRVRRGAVVKALAICTQHPHFHIFQPLLVLGLQAVYEQESSGNQLQVLENVYESINAMDLSKMPTLSVRERVVRKTVFHEKSETEFDTSIVYDGVSMPIKIPLTLMPGEIAKYQVISLVKKFGAGVVTILNALLAEKRILFIGFESRAEDICTHVLACYGIVCPPLTGILNRFFPYTNLSSLDFTQVPGYVAGVANPMFEDHREWWDVLCDVTNGKITLNPDTMAGWDKLPSAKVDAAFYSRVNEAINSHLGEEVVRARFQAYLQHIIDIAFDDEEFVDAAQRSAETTANASRIASWKKTMSYPLYAKQREEDEKSLVVERTIPGLIRKLRVRKDLDDTEMLKIYKTFVDHIKTEQQVIEFLSFLPDIHGGLYPIAVSLFHSNTKVKEATVELFKRLDAIKSGSDFISSLNFFLFLAYNNGQRAKVKE